MNQKFTLGQKVLASINEVIYEGTVLAVQWNEYSHETEYKIELTNMDGDQE